MTRKGYSMLYGIGPSHAYISSSILLGISSHGHHRALIPTLRRLHSQDEKPEQLFFHI
jgi:hypothetical protein